MAPANNASIADGPALKLCHSIFTFGPIAFSNQPFALPIIACECVIFGNAATRTTTFCAWSAALIPRSNSNFGKLIFIIRSGSHFRAPPWAEHWLLFSFCAFSVFERVTDWLYRQVMCSQE